MKSFGFGSNGRHQPKSDDGHLTMLAMASVNIGVDGGVCLSCDAGRWHCYFFVTVSVDISIFFVMVGVDNSVFFVTVGVDIALKCW